MFKTTIKLIAVCFIVNSCGNSSILMSSVPNINDMAKMADMGHDEMIKLLIARKYKLSSSTVIQKQRITQLNYRDAKNEVNLSKNELQDGGDVFKWINISVLPKETESGFYKELESIGFKLLREENGIGIRTKVFRRANETVNISQFEDDKIPLTVSYMKLDHEIRL